MKTKLATLAVFLCCGIASADITMSGTGKVTFTPNMAQVFVGISSEGLTAQQAWKTNADVVKKLFQTLKDNHIDLKDIKTTGLNVSPQYVYHAGQKPELVGYTVTYNLSVIVRKLPEVGKVLDAMVSNGANQGMNISFTHDKLESMLDEVRSRAVADARHKAELFVKGAGANLGNVLIISEYQYSPPRPFYYERAMKASAADSLPIAAGQQDLSVNVTVTWAIKNG